MTFTPGERVTVHHEKPWLFGCRITMEGEVVSFDGRLLVLHRTFPQVGEAYEGVHAIKRKGDFGTIELVRGGWVVRRRYFRADGTPIGELFNVNLPTRFEPHAARSVDLEIDVAWLPELPERVEVQDEAPLAQAVVDGYISPEVAWIARWIAHELADRLRAWDGRSRLDWDIRPTLTERTTPSHPDQ
ncbi:MAG: DUF402 domain-containing protein [Myxococcaceae bacterium]|nr:DUF402 domain-containing protein [Myxococcaceae bacterium]